jgi:hypothetical protein
MDIPKQLAFLPAFSIDAEKMSAIINKKLLKHFNFFIENTAW